MNVALKKKGKKHSEIPSQFFISVHLSAAVFYIFQNLPERFFINITFYKRKLMGSLSSASESSNSFLFVEDSGHV